MGDKLAEIRGRVAAFAADAEIAWPPAGGIETEGDRAHGWMGPNIAGTYLPVAVVGLNLARDWARWRPRYDYLTEAQAQAACDYYLAHTDLFVAESWRKGNDPVGLQADVAALLGLVGALTAERERDRAVVEAVREWDAARVAANETKLGLGSPLWANAGATTIPVQTLSLANSKERTAMHALVALLDRQREGVGDE